MLSGQGRRVFRILIMVLNIVVAIISFRRGETVIGIVFIIAAGLLLYRLARPSSDGRGRDDQTPPHP